MGWLVDYDVGADLIVVHYPTLDCRFRLSQYLVLHSITKL